MSCSCDLIGSVFTNSSQTCFNNILSFSTTLSYATDDGFITASYIIALLMADINNGRNTSLVIDAQSMNIISDELCSNTSLNNGRNTSLFIEAQSINNISDELCSNASLNNGSLVIDAQSIDIIIDELCSNASSNAGVMIGLPLVGLAVAAMISGIIITVIAVLV